MPTDTNNLRRYLLRDLSEAERAAVEDGLFTGELTAEELFIAEDELIDAYIQNDLPRHERSRLEDQLVDSPRLAERVRTATALQSRAGSHHRAVTVSRPPWWDSLIARLQLPYGPVLVGVSVLLLCAGSALVAALVSSNLSRRQIAVMMAERDQAFRGELNERERQWQDTIGKLQPASTAAVDPRVAQPDLPTPPTAPLFSFLLLPGSTRAVGGGQRILIAGQPPQIQLQLELRTAGEHRRYRAIIRDGSDNQVWSGSQDAPAPARRSPLPVTVPAAVLRSGDYTLALSGESASGDVEALEDYAFRVARQ